MSSSSEPLTAAAWLRSQRAAGATLPALQHDLRSQKSQLDASLTSAITEKLPTLVDISGSVGATSEKLKKLSTQLEVHRAATAEFTSRIDARRAEFAASIDERADLLRRADEVRLLRRLAEALSNLEALVAPADSAEPAPTLQATADRLLRASSECGRLLLLRQRTAELPAVGASLGRVATARSALLTQLGACLHRALTEAAAAGDDGSSGGSSPIDAVLRGYAEAEGEDEAAKWVRSAWVAPRLSPLLATAAEAADASLASLANVLITFVRGPEFAPLARADAAARQPLHLVCAGPWVEFCNHISESQTHLFGAGMPATFHAAYLALHDGMHTLETSMPPSMAHRLRSHPATAAVQRKFNPANLFPAAASGDHQAARR